MTTTGRGGNPRCPNVFGRVKGSRRRWSSGNASPKAEGTYSVSCHPGGWSAAWVRGFRGGGARGGLNGKCRGPSPRASHALNSIENSTYRTAFKLRSLQTLCQLDLIGSSLIQHVLLRQHLWEAGESTLSLQQLFQALQAMFQKVRVEKPGQVHPRASELTLSLLTTMYDSTGTGFLKLAPAAAALITLSGDSPLTKYRALFQLYAENNRGGHDLGARMTRRVLRNLLTDLQQIPAVVGESRALCSVESATRSCFQGVLSPVIKEEKFLSWLQSEPPILLWIPTCYRLSATEMATHPVRCRICRNFPITGLRYRCLKCLNFDICQVCFLSSLQGESHQKSHPVVENCIQMSAKDNAKLILRTLRNNLLQGRCRRKEAARRQWLLDKVNPKDVANRAWARLLKKQLNQHKDKLQAIYACQEEKSCRYDTKIHELTINQDSLWTKLHDFGKREGAMNIQERNDELEKEELQEILSKLTDAFTLETPSDLQSSVNLDLYCGAEGVCRAFSALVDQITLTDLK
ncbi:dystrotelin [Dama dama]